MFESNQRVERCHDMTKEFQGVKGVIHFFFISCIYSFIHLFVYCEQ